MSLIIIDDCASTKDMKKRTGELITLGYSGRHGKISTIVITQQLLKAIAKGYRDNISKRTDIILQFEWTEHEDSYGSSSFRCG